VAANWALKKLFQIQTELAVISPTNEKKTHTSPERQDRMTERQEKDTEFIFPVKTTSDYRPYIKTCENMIFGSSTAVN